MAPAIGCQQLTNGGAPTGLWRHRKLFEWKFPRGNFFRRRMNLHAALRHSNRGSRYTGPSTGPAQERASSICVFRGGDNPANLLIKKFPRGNFSGEPTSWQLCRLGSHRRGFPARRPCGKFPRGNFRALPSPFRRQCRTLRERCIAVDNFPKMFPRGNFFMPPRHPRHGHKVSPGKLYAELNLRSLDRPAAEADRSTLSASRPRP